MKFIKRFLIAVVVLVVLAIGALLLLPILFKDQVVANVKQAVNSAVTAEVDFADVNLSFLRSFPDVSLVVDEFSVIGVDTFAGLPLVTGERAQLDVGFWSVVGGDGTYQIDAVRLDEPTINLRVLSPELANYLIVPETDPAPTDPPPAPASAQIELQHFEIHDGTLTYDDRTTETYLEIGGLTAVGDGDFTAAVFDVDAGATAESFTLRQAGVTYLNRVRAVADAVVNVDVDNSRYTFRENKFTINALDLVMDGSIALDGDDVLFDLAYAAPVNDFRQVWSLVPAAFTAGYDDVDARGSFTLDGTVRGTYNGERAVYPAFTVNSTVSGGSVRYPGRPIGITGIDAQLGVNSPGSDLNKLVVRIPRFDFDLGGDPFRGRLTLASLLRDPQVDGKIDGTIDLGKWAQAVPLEGVRRLAGVLKAKLTFDDLRQSLVESGRYDNLDLGGTVGLTGFVYDAEELPPVAIDALTADFTPRAVTVSEFTGQLGRSDLRASGRLDNPLAYFSPEQTMRGQFTLAADYFDADEWMPAADPAAAGPSPAELAENQPAAPTEIFDRFDFDVDATIGRLAYAGYAPTDLTARGNVKPNRLEVDAATATLGKTSFTGQGTILNLFDYTLGDGVLGGKLDVRSPFVDVADLMVATTGEEAAPGATDATAGTDAAVPVPANIDLTVALTADRVRYDDIDLDAMVGQLLLRGGQAVIEDGRANVFGGRVDFAGAYDTSEPGDPGFRFHYDLQNVDFGQSFAALNTFAALAPIGKFLQGRFSTDLVMEGKLGADLFPKLSSIDAKGLFRTAEAQLTGLTPLRKIGQALNVAELKQSTTLRNLVTIFNVEDGRVAVEPFDLKVAGIPMTVSGTHGLELDMDYTVRAAIPRDMIQGNLVTGAALSALDRLAGQAGRLGLDISPGDVLNVAIKLGGSLSDPSVKFDLLGTGEGDDDDNAIDAVSDAIGDQLNEQVNEHKAEAERQVNERIDAARQDAQRRIDSLRAVAGDRARLVQDSIRRAVAAREQRLREQAALELQRRLKLDSLRADSLLNVVPGVDANRVREELERFNPFKKKKKTGGR